MLIGLPFFRGLAIGITITDVCRSMHDSVHQTQKIVLFKCPSFYMAIFTVLVYFTVIESKQP